MGEEVCLAISSESEPDGATMGSSSQLLELFHTCLVSLIRRAISDHQIVCTATITANGLSNQVGVAGCSMPFIYSFAAEDLTVL